MSMTGGCYCRSLQYEMDTDAVLNMQCHCRECQYISGGALNVALGLPSGKFSYTKGAPESFSRKDLENPITRELCGKVRHSYSISPAKYEIGCC